VDTREKIVPLERLPDLLQNSDWIVLPGLFDPMTAVQAKRIAQQGQNGHRMLVIVLEDGESLLSAEARATLVASLRAVDAVAIARAGQWQDLIPANVSVLDEDLAAERERTAEFVKFLIARQNAAGGGAQT
jgi:hypothetical protein